MNSEPTQTKSTLYNFFYFSVSYACMIGIGIGLLAGVAFVLGSAIA